MKSKEGAAVTVGELAGRTGITVRTLQYYDRIGLLKPGYSEGGRRMYRRDDILKLQQILFLKSLGFSLDEIGEKILKQPASGFAEVFMEQRELLTSQIGNLNRIVRMLDTAIDEIRIGKEISLEKLMVILEQFKQGNPYTFVVRYFGDEQLRHVGRRFESPEESRQYMERAKEVFAALDRLYRQNADPSGPEGQELAGRWWKMVGAFTGGDPVLLRPLLSAGRDIANWPAEAVGFREAIEHFLSPALETYFRRHNIQIPEMEAGKSE